MSDFTSGNVPGFQTKQESEEKQIVWSGPQGQDLVATKKVVIESTNQSVEVPDITTTTTNVEVPVVHTEDQ